MGEVRMFRKAGILVALLGSLLLGGCGTMQTAEKIDTIKSKAKTEAEEILQEHRSPRDVAYTEAQHPDIVGTPYTLFKGERLPDVFKGKYTLAISQPEPLQGIAQRITSLSGIPVIISDDVTNVDPFPFTLKGNLKYILDVLASRANADWEYKDGVISMYRYITRVYYLNTLPGKTTVTQELNADASSQGSGSKSEHKAKLDMKADIWKSVSDTVKSMLSKDGKAVTNEASGAIAVTDTKDVQARVAAYIRQENRRLRRQVVVDVKLVMFTADENSQHGIDWNLLYNNGDIGVGLNNITPSDPLSGALSINILDGNFNGSEALIKALDGIGETSLITSIPVTTISNQPANIVIADEQYYIAEIKTNLVANAGATQEVTQDTVSTGVSMSVTPRVLTDRKLVLQMELNLTALLGFDETKVGGRDNSVTLKSPNQTRRSFMQRVLLESGQTLVLTGFENNMGILDKNGILGRDAWALGGQRKGQYKNAMLVLMVTPRVINEGVF